MPIQYKKLYSAAVMVHTKKVLVTIVAVCVSYVVFRCIGLATDVHSKIISETNPIIKDFICRAPNNPKFYSQGNEDVSFYERFYKHPVKCNGTVLEMGALNGVRFSISKFYEDYLGWKSILIEADPNNFRQISKNRPKSKTYNTAICRGEHIKFVANNKEGAVGGIVDTMSKRHKQVWIPNKSNPITVPCSRLENILKDVQHIDLFILDVEGGELEALLTMDWEVSVDYWVIELDGTNKGKDSAVRDLLLSKGYKKAKWNIKQLMPDGGLFMNEVFSKSEIGKTVFSFALFDVNSTNTAYVLANTDLVSQIFPGWEVYIYYDHTVSIAVVNKLRKKPNTILTNMSNSSCTTKLLWSFLVASDPHVDRYIIRDLKSHLSFSLKSVVEGWFASKKKFFAMRDMSSVSMMGTMWGGQHDALPNMQDLLLKHESKNLTNKYSSFIETVVWTKAQYSVYTP